MQKLNVWNIIELDDGKIYRKALYLMVKQWFPVDFPIIQSIELNVWNKYIFRYNMFFWSLKHKLVNLMPVKSIILILLGI